MVKKGSIFGKKEERNDQNTNNMVDTENSANAPQNTENMAEPEEFIDPGVRSEDNSDVEDVQKEEPTHKIDEYKAQVQDLQDKYIRLMAEFDNFRKRSLKERTDLIKSAGEDILLNILPVMDDFERGLSAMEKAQDVESVKQGVLLIYNKFKDFLAQRGVKEIEASKQDFNVDMHEAITKIPAPEEDLKGKVVDVVQKGYYLNDKVIRFAKVVIGE